MPLLDNMPSLKGSKVDGDVYPTDKNMPPYSAAAYASKEVLPSYAPEDPNTEPQGPGPSPEELNAAFASLTLTTSAPAFPVADQCLAHLKLLSAFHILKEDIGYTDGMFGLWDAKCEMLENKDETLAKMREKRWTLYIARAVERFEAWWLGVVCALEESRRLECKDMVVTCRPFAQFTQIGRVQTWTPDMLPPIGK